MFSGFITLFDSSVLYSAPTRDLLIELATAGLYRAKWSQQIHKEWSENLIKNRPDIDSKRLEKTISQINESVEDCLVENYEFLIDILQLPDINDRHVLAAAIKGQAQIIVTFNVKDFPNKILNNFNIESQHPDDFFINQIELNPAIFLTKTKIIRESLKKPPKTPQEYLECLRKCSLIKTANFLESYIELL